MDYISNTIDDQKEMLKVINIKDIKELFSCIPKELKPKSFNIPEGKSEFEVRKYLYELSGKNSTHLISFLGGGFYDHYIPVAVDAITGRSEFYTSYTPYQPEASQGVLRSIFEYQSAVCRLTEMDVSNSSLYDGGTALYEAAMMSTRITGRKKIIVDEGVNPIYRKMLRTYTSNLSLELVEIPALDGVVDRKKILSEINDSVSAVVLQNPNFFGGIDDYTDIFEQVHKFKGIGILSFYPLSLGILKTPGEMGADIAVAEGQSLGIPLSFGGPYLGVIATKLKYVREMPGRIVGSTVDNKGRRGYVLTLQTREQHIRRERATSNICSNETLCAIRALVYCTLIGKEGIKEAANLCLAKSEYTKNRLMQIKNLKIKFSTPTFNEFVIELPKDAADLISTLIEKGFAAGFPLGRYYKGMEKCLLVALTEKRTKEEIGCFAEALEASI
ncbi:MAG: aminomethyl-transferring glycine dehydrogenase subunit GcvPA [Elusimicrobia bacterium]|nr:aminomethyl-transferring glycine dehydrogenase subunit GcvPA [Elusimicrobiota bacterium]